MRLGITLVAPIVALAAIGGARIARQHAKQTTTLETVPAPYAPSPAAAPIVTLGFRELGADLLFVRLVGYFGTKDNVAADLAALAEAIAALDPQFKRVYEFGAVAMTGAHRGVDNDIRLRAIALLEAAARAFPDDWRFPKLAGEIYLVDLVTDDAAQRRDWDAKGTRLLETAIRKPRAPAGMAAVAATLRTRLGQKQRAIDGLREMLLITEDKKARERIILKLAELSETDADAIAGEIAQMRREFEARWLAERPAVTPSMYVLIGARTPPGFDLGELALGGVDLVVPEPQVPLEPLVDEAPPTPAPLPAPPPTP